jgi:sulfite reductase alpha subunit-like flavoprotein
MGLDPNSELSIRRATPMAAPNIPLQLSVLQLFTFVLDICARPSAAFFDDLRLLAHTPEEAAAVDALKRKTHNNATPSDALRYDYVDLIGGGMLPEVLRARLGLPQLLRMVPGIKPRLYSISSSPAAPGRRDTLQLTVLRTEYTPKLAHGANVPEGSKRHGLCSNYITAAPPTLWTRVFKSGIKLPATVCVPLVMVGTGVGIAPWRGMVQDRYCKMKADTAATTGPMRLYYGTMHAAEALTYKEEFDRMRCDGLPLTFRCAFSREDAASELVGADDECGVHVDALMRADGAILYDAIANTGGMLFICGASRAAPASVYAAMKDIVMTHGGMPEQAADAFLATLKLQGRYVVETFE